jgi:hypothetical protein
MSAEPPATKDDGRKGDVVYGDFRDDRGTIDVGATALVGRHARTAMCPPQGAETDGGY